MMMEVENAPLVSVCVPTYQHEPYIRACIESILRQKTNFSFEIVIGEDASTDGTREICQAYSAKYPDKIRLFLRSRKDVIYIDNRATGRFNFTETMKAARGKYIALCEGDDYWVDDHKLQMQVEFLEMNPGFSLVHTNVNHVNKNGDVVLPAPLKYKDVMTHEEVSGVITVQTLTMVFRADALGVFPAEFYRVFNADLFLVAMLSEKGKVKFINKVTGCYRKHEGGIFTGINYKNRQVNRLETLVAMLHYFSNPKVKQNLKTAISKSYGRILYAELSMHNYAGFFRFLMKTIYFDVTNFRFSFVHLINHALKKLWRK